MEIRVTCIALSGIGFCRPDPFLPTGVIIHRAIHYLIAFLVHKMSGS